MKGEECGIEGEVCKRVNVISPTKQSKDAGDAENKNKRSEIQAFS